MNWLLVWCSVYGADICLDTKFNIFDSSSQAVSAYDALNRQQQTAAILWGGTRYEVLSKYEIKPSTK